MTVLKVFCKLHHYNFNLRPTLVNDILLSSKTPFSFTLFQEPGTEEQGFNFDCLNIQF